MPYYQKDLAYIHDVGYGNHARNATAEILTLLKQQGITQGLVVELGCGSGSTAHLLLQAGYQVLGIDQSEALVTIARHRVPQAEFRVESFFQTTIPLCQAVISIGECLNYRFDTQSSPSSLTQLFQRIYTALSSGGLFLFDLLEPGQVPPGQTIQGFREGEDWLVLVEKQEDPSTHVLTRRIITLRQVGELWRRSDEIHEVQLYQASSIAADLETIGFQVQSSHNYGTYQLSPTHAVFMARKP